MKKLAHQLTLLDAKDAYRIKMTDQLLEKACAATLSSSTRIPCSLRRSF